MASLLAEDVACVDKGDSAVIVFHHTFHHLFRAYDRDISYGLHITYSVLGHAEEVDEIACCLGILCVYGYRPSVKPHIGAFFWHDIVKVNAYLGSLFDGPCGVSAPCHVCPCLSLCHCLFPEIDLPSEDIRLGTLHQVLDEAYPLVRHMPDELTACHFPRLYVVNAGVAYQA